MSLLCLQCVSSEKQMINEGSCLKLQCTSSCTTCQQGNQWNVQSRGLRSCCHDIKQCLRHQTVLLSSSWNHLSARVCWVLPSGQVPSHVFIHRKGLSGAMAANIIQLLLQHGLGVLHVVLGHQHVVPMEVDRAMEWNAHCAQHAPQSLDGSHSVLHGDELGTGN
jgi:hypothetical protein